MDPLSALSVACNIIDLVGKAISVGKVVLEVYKSLDGLNAANESINREADGLKAVVADLQGYQSQTSYRTAEQKMQEVSDILVSQCVELQEVLDGCRSSQKWALVSASYATLKILLKKGKIEQLQNDIVSSRDELFRWVAASTRAGVNAALEQLKTIDQRNCEIQNTLNDVEIQLRLALGGTESGAAACLDEIKQLVADRVILQLLYTPILGSRFEDVPTQEEGTFEWIFTDPEAVLKKEPHLAMTFPTWLESGDGIFHVCGKPGSGKSTLMKYICRNPYTKELLYKWAGDNELLIAKFFFWRIGAEQQKNMKGLIRGLLYEVLDKVPNLSRHIFPRETRDRLVHGLHKHHYAEFNFDEMIIAFSRLVEVSTSSNLGQNLHGIRICLFIDGLDEFDIGKINQSYRELVSKLMVWTTHSDGHVKICVSSRIEEPFMDMLEERKRLTLHSLTMGDIKLFIERSLESHPKFQMHQQKSPQECRALIYNIIESAEGVFLWVALVLKELETGLNDGIPIKCLQKTISEKPTDLETLLEQIMRSISKSSRRGVEVLLSAVLRATGTVLETRDQVYRYRDDYHLSSLSAFFILRAADRGVLMNNEFVMSDFDFESEGWLQEGMTDNEVMQTVNNIVRARCKGLIDIVKDYKNPWKVKFMHRSVPEFLLTYFSHASVPISDHSNTVAASWSLLIDVKWISAKYSHSLSLFSFLHSESVSMSSNKIWDLDVQCWLIQHLNNFIGMLTVKLEDEWEEVFRIHRSIEQILSLYGHFSMSIVVISAFEGLHEFIGWLFRKTDVLTNESIRSRLIFEAITRPKLSPRLIKILFAQVMDGRLVLPAGDGRTSRRDLERHPAWHYAVLCMTLGSKDHRERFGADLEDCDIRAIAIELWLRYGANPRVRFRLSENGRKCVGVSSAPDNSDYFSCGDHYFGEGYEVSSGLRRIGKRELSLRDIVLDWKPHNESVLLELLKDDVEDESPITQAPIPIQSHSSEKIDGHMKDASTPQDSTTNLEHEQSCGVTGLEQPPYAWVMHISAGLYPCLAFIGALGIAIAYFVQYTL
ncbi:hypothetical protein F5Y01DRAFT_283844 [Xylaria sp. FL0043]|nr:hypothetical protein F5Y01DRAFT_283844 [Xylaria sp. FL0043]